MKPLKPVPVPPALPFPVDILSPRGRTEEERKAGLMTGLGKFLRKKPRPPFREQWKDPEA